MERRGEPQKHWFFYGECVRNHTTELGKVTTDGCGEFMPNERIPDHLLCVACGCHRNYHRKTVYIESNGEGGDEEFPMETELVADAPSSNDGRRGQQQQNEQMVVPEVVAELPPNMAVTVAERVAVSERGELEELDARKRPRTTFTDVQKERMRMFAEELEWKMVRQRNNEINNFCNEIGVSRQSFKVWMHNHKNTSCSSILVAMASMAHDGTSSASAGGGNTRSSGIKK